jgi:hypothetical protein
MTIFRKSIRQLFKKIAKYHGEYFSEDNVPSIRSYLHTVLDRAIDDEFQTDRINDLLQQISNKPVTSIETLQEQNVSKFEFIDRS